MLMRRLIEMLLVLTLSTWEEAEIQDLKELSIVGLHH
jgi:hypothetical protein